MSNLTKYPLEDGFNTTLSQARDGAAGTVYVNDTPSFTFPSGVTTYIVVNPWKSTMQVAEINAYDASAKTITVSSTTANKAASVAYSEATHWVGSIVRISDNYQFWEDIATAINSKVNTNSGDTDTGKFADATARDAYFTSPANGNSAYLISTWVWTDYIGWAWTDRATWSTANASTTVAGKVEIATDAQVQTETDTGETGAELVATPSQLSPAKLSAKGSAASGDKVRIADSADSDSAAYVTVSQLVAWAPASEDAAWSVERATDAEATAWTDTTRYITPKQGSDNYCSSYSNLVATRVLDASSGSVNYAHGLWKTPKMITCVSIGSFANRWDGSWTSSSQHMVGGDARTYSDQSTVSGSCIRLNDWANYQQWQISSVDGTNITIAWTKSGSPATVNGYVLITCRG